MEQTARVLKVWRVEHQLMSRIGVSRPTTEHPRAFKVSRISFHV